MLTEKESCPKHIDWCLDMNMKGAKRKWSCTGDEGVQVNGTEKGLNKIERHVNDRVN